MIAKAPDISDEKSSSLKEKSLKAAGWSYVIGDAAYIASGIVEKKWERIGTGIFWGLGGAAAARYGNPSAEKQIELLCGRLGEYLNKQGVVIPKSPKTAELAKQGGVIDHIESFLYAHPSEALNTIYALGAGQLIYANHAKLNGQGLTPKLDFATGILVGAGSLAGLLIPEKKPDPEHPAQGTLEKAKAWVHEKPLRASAGFFWGGNIATLIGAVAQMKEAKKNNSGYKGYLWRFLIAGCYIFANSMLSLSSKGHTDDKTDVTPQVADVSAAVIAAQPKEVQEALVQSIAGYLSAQPEIKKTAPEIAELLHAKLGEVKQALPIAGKWQQRLEKGSPPQLSPSV